MAHDTPVHLTGLDERAMRIHRLALARLQQLEKEIAETYHRRIVCGMELEFNYRTDTGQMPEKAIDLYQYDERRNQPNRPKKDPKHSFMESPFLEVLEPDGKPEQQCYEFKISKYRDQKIGGWDQRSAPSVTARAAHHIRRIAEQRTPEFMPGHEAQFLAADPLNPPETADLHVNVSLWNDSYSKSMIHEMDLDNSIQIQKLLYPIAVESSNAFERIGRHKGVARQFIWSMENKFGNTLGYRAMGEDEHTTRFEDRLYGAEIDPALAALVTVSGIYWSLKHKKAPIPLDASIAHTMDMPKTAQEYEPYLTAMEQSPLARELLGDALFKEVVSLRREQFEAMRAGKETPRHCVKVYEAEPLKTATVGQQLS